MFHVKRRRVQCASAGAVDAVVEALDHMIAPHAGSGIPIAVHVVKVTQDDARVVYEVIAVIDEEVTHEVPSCPL